MATRVNQLGYSRSTPVPVIERQRSDLPGEPDQSGAERQAARAEGIGASGCGPISASAGHDVIFPADRINREYWRYSFGVERQFPSGLLVELSYLGQKGTNVPILE